ncbi:MAG: lipoprotein [Lysobacter sp.]|nr:lipoprotein [Lysobacter sp.]
MNARHATPLVLTALTLALAACGNKGPLVLPTQPAPQEAPPAKPGEVPVTISKANDPPVATAPVPKSLPTPPLDSVLTPPTTQDGKDSKDAKDKDGKTQDGDGSDATKPAEPTPAGG